jgi:phospholipase C
VSDDERIERLTQLARRVPEWASWRIEVFGDEHTAYVTAIGEGEREVVAIQHAPSARALDALEAALLVLAGDTPLVAAGQGAMSVLATPILPVDEIADREVAALQAEGERRRQEVRKACEGVMGMQLSALAWVDQLAAEWEASAPDAGEYPIARRLLNDCAAELRERAKGGERG